MNNISKRIEDIDLLAEERLLSFSEWEERIELERRVDRLIAIEELQWKQRASKNWILQRDANTQLSPICEWQEEEEYNYLPRL
jgi:hypothetical protein